MKITLDQIWGKLEPKTTLTTLNEQKMEAIKFGKKGSNNLKTAVKRSHNHHKWVCGNTG